MKNLILIAAFSSSFLVSCKKENRPFTTSFQLSFTDYFTGDTLPDVSFSVQGQNTGQYNFSSHTNVYGNFDTIFTHETQTNFDVSPTSYQYYVVATNSVITGGTNTQAQIGLAFPGSIKFVTDCSGTGYIQNIQYQRLFPIPDSTELESHTWAQAGTPGYMDCGSINTVDVFPGEWIVSYDYKPSVSGSWSPMYDTVSVESNLVTVCTIVY